MDRVHFVGIGGYGMSALAFILGKMGLRVTGSDLKSSRLTERLERAGVIVYCGHHEEHAAGADLVVYSTAIPAGNPELLYAARNGIPLWHRSELLASLMNCRRGIAVAGTHGKTTTTAMISCLLEAGGMDPTAVIGGELASLQGNARLGQGPCLVAEACESDHSFLRYRPHYAVVTNVEADHLEFYDGDFRRLVASYLDFLGNVDPRGRAFLCLDDPELRSIIPRVRVPLVTYGVHPEADYCIEFLRYQGLGSHFRVHCRGASLGEVELRVPGLHNVVNALGALAVGLELGVPFDRCAEGLGAFLGVRRRFEILGKVSGVTVVDDYAHHPTEVQVTLQAARSSGKRVVAVFQPHRYTRVHYLMEEFSRSFDEADLLIIDSVYSAGEAPISGVTAGVLARLVEQREGPEVCCPGSREKLMELTLQSLQSGDILVTMGAGDIWQVALNVYEYLQAAEEEEEAAASRQYSRD